MFGNSYTAIVIQINGEDAGQQIWKELGGIPFIRDVERCPPVSRSQIGTRICYSDLTFIILQGDTPTMEQNKQDLIQMIDARYGGLLARKMLFLSICPNIAKNTFTKGVVSRSLLHGVEGV